MVNIVEIGGTPTVAYDQLDRVAKMQGVIGGYVEQDMFFMNLTNLAA
jgi:hypothetical protein